MDLPFEPEDESTEPSPAPPRPPSFEEEIEALRPPLEGRQPSGAKPPEQPKPSKAEKPKRGKGLERGERHVDLTVWPSRLLTVASLVLLVVGVVLWRQAEGVSGQGTTAVVAGESALRAQSPTSTTSTTAPVAAADPVTTATSAPPAATAPADPAPAVTPEPSTTTTTARPTTTTSTTTTTRPPAPPRPISATSASAVFPGVQLTLKADPPGSGAIRTAQFSVEAEFGDARVLRSARFELGDGTAVDGSVQSWPCGDPGAPNPYVLAGPTYTYAAPGTYAVTVTVRTAPCGIDGGTEGPEETAQVRLVLTVP